MIIFVFYYESSEEKWNFLGLLLAKNSFLYSIVFLMFVGMSGYCTYNLLIQTPAELYKCLPFPIR